MAICFFYFLLSSVLLYCHIKNYMANRTTSERLASKRKGRGKRTGSVSSSNTDTSNLSSSIMSYSDFNESQTMMVDETNAEMSKAPAPKPKKVKSKGCCVNIWKMSTHTRIVPQDRLYNYLADRSMEIEDEDLQFSGLGDRE
jgi:hypothetical protein